MVEASSEAAATVVASSCERSAVADSVVAEDFELGRGRGHGLDNLSDRALEVVGETDHLGLALLGGDLVLSRLGFRLLARFRLGVFPNDGDSLGHVADFVSAAGAGYDNAEIAGRHLRHRRSHAHHGADHAHRNAGDAEDNDQHNHTGHAPHQHRELLDPLCSHGLKLGIAGIGALHDLVDDCAVRVVDRCQLVIGMGSLVLVALGERRQQLVLDKRPEASDLGIGFDRKSRLQLCFKIGLLPELLTFVEFLVQLSEPLLVLGDLLGIPQRQRRLQVSLNHIGRRRQDVGDEVIAEFDLRIERPPDAKLAVCISADCEDRAKPKRGDHAEEHNGGKNRNSNFHHRPVAMLAARTSRPDECFGR